MKVLFATSEAFPLIKTGGLADVSQSLPNALSRQGLDVRLVLPAYREVLRKLTSTKILGWLKPLHDKEVRILEASHADFDMPIWLVDDAPSFDREGNPYMHSNGGSWHDNAERFALFSRCVALLAIDGLHMDWRADVVHTNDWQTAMANAFLSQESKPPQRIFTIHNLAYDNPFDYATFQRLNLPQHWWSIDFGEFHHQFSPLKTGLMFCDQITTVSPTYAEEICTPTYGYGFAGILNANKHKLSGIINGIDQQQWNPSSDKLLATNYTAEKGLRPGKRKNRESLIKKLDEEFVLEAGRKAPVFGFVGRLAYQKGVDLILDAIPAFLEEQDGIFILIGSGELDLASRIHGLAEQFPNNILHYIGYSEELAHLLEAGCDFFLMPSRYEPCGLNQLYSMHYGTPPIVRKTGGLADSVTDYSTEKLAYGTATGIVFDAASSSDLLNGMFRAATVYNKPRTWDKLARNGMAQDFSWDSSARAYIELYQQTS